MLSGSIASVVRMIYLDSIIVPTGSFFKNISKLTIWSTIEPGVGITVASVATLRRLFQRIFKMSKLFGSRERQDSITPQGILCTTTITQEHEQIQGNVTGLGSDATALQGSGQTARRGPVVEESMAYEMRAYGMHDFDNCATVTERDLEQYVEYEDVANRRSTVYGDRRVTKLVRTLSKPIP